MSSSTPREEHQDLGSSTEVSWSDPGDAVVLRAPSLEQAMTAAQARYGPEAQVVAARRVRRGVRGLVHSAGHVEVLVRGGTASSPDPARGRRFGNIRPPSHIGPEPAAVAAELDSAFDALLAAAEASEAIPEPRAPSPAPPPPAATGLLARQALAPRIIPAAVVTSRRALTAPQDEPIDVEAVEPVDIAELVRTVRGALDAVPLDDPDSPEPERAAPPSPVPTALRSESPAAGWSRDRLAALGVPEQVLAALPRAAPSSDIDWLVALHGALVRCGVTSAPESSVRPVSRSQEGNRVLAALDFALAGSSTPLTVPRRRTTADALELAIAIRTLVLR